MSDLKSIFGTAPSEFAVSLNPEWYAQGHNMDAPDHFVENEVLSDHAAVYRPQRRPAINDKWFMVHTAQRQILYPIPRAVAPRLAPDWRARSPMGVLFARDLVEEGIALVGNDLRLWASGREIEARAKFEAAKAVLEGLSPKREARRAGHVVRILAKALESFVEGDAQAALDGFHRSWPAILRLVARTPEVYP